MEKDRNYRKNMFDKTITRDRLWVGMLYGALRSVPPRQS